MLSSNNTVPKWIFNKLYDTIWHHQQPVGKAVSFTLTKVRSWDLNKISAILQTFSNEFPLKWVPFDLIIYVPILVWLMSGADQVKSHYWSPLSHPGQDGRHFAEGIFRCISMNEEFCVLMKKISLKCVPRGPIDNNPALIKIMGWCQIGDEPLSELMLTRFTDIYVRH